MKSLYIYLVISLSILPLTSSISFSFEQQKTKQCFSRTIHANNEIALQFQIIGSSQLKIQTTLTQNNQQTFKTIKNHYSELDSIKKPKKLSIDHTCTLCFEVINRGSLSSMTPSIAFHFSQSNPEDSMQTDYIHSQQIMRTIQKLKGTHHRLLNSLLDVQLSLENEQYQQQEQYQCIWKWNNKQRDSHMQRFQWLSLSSQFSYGF